MRALKSLMIDRRKTTVPGTVSASSARGGVEDLLAATQASFHLAERTCWLSPAGVDEFPELGVGLKDDGFPILFGHTYQHCGWLALARNDHSVFLRLRDESISVSLQVLDCGLLHRMSSVVRPAGFMRMARIELQ
jgi:hypothetical protein